MNKIIQHKKQIFTFITIFLLLEFGVYPCLTMANTFANIVGAVALLLLVLWGGFSLYDYVKNSEGLVDKKELSEAEQQWKEHVQMQMEKMNEANSKSVETNPKRKYTKKTK